MHTYAVYLKPKSSFITWPSSDTLFGALCWAAYHLHGKERLEEELNKFKENPKFILSSAFPYLDRDGTRIHFFPKPLLRELNSTEVEALAIEELGKKLDKESLEFKQAVIKVRERLKEFKKISYVSESIFKEITELSLDLKGIYQRLKDTGSAETDIEKLGNALISFREREKLDPEKEMKSLISEVDVLRNQIDRVGGSTVEGLLFTNKEISLHRIYGGIWFLVKTNDLEFLKPLFRYLEDTGIGGKRSSGKGHFGITWKDKPYMLPEAENPDSFIVLSRWFPDENELDFDNGFASWNIINLRSKRETMYPVGGERILKDLLRLFSEGSIFPLKERKEYYGKLVPAGNMGTYTAYHNGIALPIFAKIGDTK